jgi:hypothetical protein
MRGREWGMENREWGMGKCLQAVVYLSWLSSSVPLALVNMPAKNDLILTFPILHSPFPAFQ